MTGISVLTVGAAVGSLTTSPAAPRTVAAPPAVASAPAVAVAVDSRLTADALEQRELRESRSERRAALSATVAASQRQRALVKQQIAQTQRLTALKQQKAAAKKRAAEQRRTERRAADRAAAKAHQGDDSGDSPKMIARKLMQSKYGWGAAQFRCYNNIIMRESVWKVHADNPTSSAYGIPQALPGRKMASAGADWRDNPATQITWGLGYVKSRYGTPCQAWSFKQAHDWY